MEASGDKREMRRMLYAAAKRVDLASFVGQVAGVQLSGAGDSYSGVCPLHKDTDPSFGVSRGSDSVWVYHCFGCGSGGTIIDFCMEFFHLEHPWEALEMVMDRSGIECNRDLLNKALKEEKIGFDDKTHIECLHVVAARNCLRLLRSSNGRAAPWVRDAYWEMNRMLSKGDAAGIDRIGHEAVDRAWRGEDVSSE